MTTAITLEFGGTPNLKSAGRGATPEWVRILEVIVSNAEGFIEQPGVWAKVKRYDKLSTAKNIAKQLASFRRAAESMKPPPKDEKGAWEFYGERVTDGKDSPGLLWVRYNPDPKRP